jgi:hypothetical protein
MMMIKMNLSKNNRKHDLYFYSFLKIAKSNKINIQTLKYFINISLFHISVLRLIITTFPFINNYYHYYHYYHYYLII